MAKNLQSKLPPNDTLRLFDINHDATKRLAEEMRVSQTGGAAVEIARGIHDATQQAVCPSLFLHVNSYSYDDFCSIYDLSWDRLAGLLVINYYT